MRFLAVLTLGVLLAGAPAAGASESPTLLRARALYNDGNYGAAIAAAIVARRQPEMADAAGLVLGRSYLERFRAAADPMDLELAREALGAVHSDLLSSRDRFDLLVGLGQTLYLDEVFGPAAELFENALGREDVLNAGDRAQLLEWWATALDREAQSRPADRRAPVFERIVTRMEEELRRDPSNAVANYWLASATRGAGDLERAWDAAVAAWVRSRLAPSTADALRADLDRLVEQSLIPERVRSRPTREQADATAAFAAEWELVRQQWK